MKRNILASRKQLRELSSRINTKPYDRLYERLYQRCSLILETSPVQEMHWQSAWASGRTSAAVEAARTSQGRIIDLAICDAIETNGAFRARAIEELMNLQHWSTWIDPCRGDMLVNRATAEVGLATVIALDWLWDFLTEADKQICINNLNLRIIEPYLQAVDQDAWWYSAVNHWNAVLNCSAGFVGLALSDDLPAAQKAFDKSLQGLGHFFDDLGSQGGWDEGIGYWGIAMRNILLLAKACDNLLDDKRIIHHRGMDETGLFPVYFAPNGKSASFGNFKSTPLYSSLYLLDEYFNLPGLRRWLDENCFNYDITNSSWSKCGLALLFRPDRELPAEIDLAPVKIYNQIGWASIADSWPAPNFYASIKTGDLATNNSDHDMNSIQIQSDGELLIANPDISSESFYNENLPEFYDIEARLNNTISIAKSDHMPDALGRIFNSAQTENLSWVACDGSTVFGLENKFHRHVVMLPKRKFIIVLDDLHLHRRHSVDQYWHTPGEISLNESTNHAQITGSAASLHCAFASTQKFSLSNREIQINNIVADKFINLRTEFIGPGYLLTAFSPVNNLEQVDLNVTDSGSLEIVFADEIINFKRQVDKLELVV